MSADNFIAIIKEDNIERIETEWLSDSFWDGKKYHEISSNQRVFRISYKDISFITIKTDSKKFIRYINKFLVKIVKKFKSKINKKLGLN